MTSNGILTGGPPIITNGPSYDNQTGEYEITDLAGGYYDIWAVWSSENYTHTQKQPLLNDGASIEYSVTLEARKAVISGTVRDESGTPIADCFVRMRQSVSTVTAITTLQADRLIPLSTSSPTSFRQMRAESIRSKPSMATGTPSWRLVWRIEYRIPRILMRISPRK